MCSGECGVYDVCVVWCTCMLWVWEWCMSCVSLCSMCSVVYMYVVCVGV